MPHVVVECVPVSRKTASNAPMYFKKALSECENEWEQQNKAVIDTRGVRKLASKIPKNMPYFAVEFGLQVISLVVTVYRIDDAKDDDNGYGTSVPPHSQ